jgi:hypothetical protein
MTLLYTVDSLIEEVREQIDEENTDSVTTANILNVLNRGHKYAFDVYARRYPTPILRKDTLTLTSGETEYDLPEDIFEDRLLGIEINTPNRPTKVDIINYSDSAKYISTQNVPTPGYAYLVGRQIVFTQPPTGLYTASLWVLRDINTLVQPQGRVTTVNVASRYVQVDTAGSTLSSSSADLSSYVNLIDGQTGEIRCSLQIASVVGTKVTFRASPIRSAVLGRTIVGEIPTTVNQDDYICSIKGSCVPYFSTPTNNFLVEFAVECLTRKLQGPAQEAAASLEKFEKQIERVYGRRPGSARLKNTNRSWNRYSRLR